MEMTTRMRKDAFYFKHDCNARNDEKLLSVRMKYGMEGYGIYWALIEKMREDQEFSLRTNYEVLAWEFHSDEDVIRSVVNDFGLFVFSEDKSRFHSERLVNDMQNWSDIKAKRSAAGKASAISRARQQMSNTSSTNDEQREEKIREEKKEEDKKGDIIGEASSPDKKKVKKFVKPTLEEVTAYCQERHNNVDPVRWMNHYESKGWVIGKSPMKDWKAAVRTWENNNENSNKDGGSKKIARADEFTERL